MRIKQTTPMKLAGASALAVGALAIPAQQAHAAAITSITWNDGSTNVTSTNGDGATNLDTDIDGASTLVSFKVGTDEYSNFVLASSTNSSGGSASPFWGLNATDLTNANDALSATDNRLDTGQVNITDTASDYGFASAPTSLDQVVFLFDIGSNDGDIDIALIDGLGGTVIGNTITNVDTDVTAVADIDFEYVSDPIPGDEANGALKGIAISFSSFGVTEGQLASVAGVRITNGAGLDPALVGFTVPEPGSLALMGLGGLCLLKRRRR